MLTCLVGKNMINTFTYKDEKLRDWSNKGMLKCPVCGEKMLYCHGDFKIPYFRHEKNSDCPDIYSEGVTEEHINGIKLLYDWLNNQEDVSDIELEKWIPETRQRPDIYFKFNEEEYVIEYQCSPIATKYNERHDLYKLNNINDIWILGVNKYSVIGKNKSRINSKSIEREIYKHFNHIIYFDTLNSIIYKTDNGGLKYIYSYYKYNMESILKTKFNINLLKNDISNIKFDYFNTTTLKLGRIDSVVRQCFSKILELHNDTHSNYNLYLKTDYRKSKYIVLKSDRSNQYIFKINIEDFNVDTLEDNLKSEYEYKEQIIQYHKNISKFNFSFINSQLNNKYKSKNKDYSLLCYSNDDYQDLRITFQYKNIDVLNTSIYDCVCNFNTNKEVVEYIYNMVDEYIEKNSLNIYESLEEILEKRSNLDNMKKGKYEYKFTCNVFYYFSNVELNFGFRYISKINIYKNEILFNGIRYDYKNNNEFKDILDEIISNEIRRERYPNMDR